MLKKISIITLTFGLLLSVGCIGDAPRPASDEYGNYEDTARSTGETIDDQLIVTKVKSKLIADKSVSGLKINVDSYKGNVKLKGFLGSQEEIDRAISIAQSVSGVRSVTPRLVLD